MKNRIDSLYDLSIIIGMKNENLIFFEHVYETPKHYALTKYIRRHGIEKHAGNISLMFKKCNMDDHVGNLPPELLNLIKNQNISDKTAEFFDIIDTFVYGHKSKLGMPMIYDMPEISVLFGTECFLQIYEKDADEEKHYWGGTLSDVYKICFPKLGVSYALKVFKHNERNDTFGVMFRNGPIYEIANSFYAFKARPKYNNCIYMGKFINHEYMISKWQNRESSFIPDKELFAIYEMTDRERNENNYINGICTDFGEMMKTPYGKLSYKGRKLYRKMYYMRDISEIKKIYDGLKTNQDKYDFESAFKAFIQSFGQPSQSVHEQYSQIQNRLIQHIQQIQSLMHR